MNIASIDIGTNTVLLLIVKIEKGKLFPLHNEYRIPRIGKGVILNNPISVEKIELLLTVLKEYSVLINKFNCELIIANATNALRIASNRNEIIERVKNELGIEIRIISGEDEARLSFLGAISNNLSDQVKIVIDIGGGSSEIIYGRNDEIFFSKSFQIGAVSLTEKYFINNPPLKNEIIEAHNEIKKVFSDLSELTYKPEIAIGIAGTPTTLAAINLELNSFDEEKIDGALLSKEELEKHIKQLTSMTSEEILNSFSPVVKGREDVLLAGTMILNHLLEVSNLSELIVSSLGIRYGAVIDYALRNKLIS